MDVKVIMEFYGMTCAVLLPLCLILIIIFSKKGSIIERLNARLDKVASSKCSNEKTDTQKEKIQEKKPTPWEEYSKTLTCLRLRVGDTYMCVLNDLEKNMIGSRRDWVVLNPFVGEIDENTSVFTAKKVGSTLIVCGDVRIYYIEVEPISRNWFAKNIYDAFSEGVNKTELINSYSKNKIKEGSTSSQITIKLPPAKSAILEFDSNQNLCKCLFILNKSDKKSTEDGLEERMEKIRTEATEIDFWIHKQRNDYEDCVDNASFIWEKDDKLIFGLARNWRNKGTVEEFCANTGMFVSAFSTLLNLQEFPKILASAEFIEDIEMNEETLLSADEYEPESTQSQEESDIEDDMTISFQDENWDQVLNDDILDEMSDEYDREYNLNQ